MIDSATIEKQLEQIGTADTIQEIENQLSLLMGTHTGQIPLDRGLGIGLDFIDCTTPLAKSLFTAEITEKVATYIPTVRVKEVQWEFDPVEGILKPKVVITSV